jgi:amidase
LVLALIDSTELMRSADSNYTIVWNVVDYPAFLAFPVTTVHAVLDVSKPVHGFLSDEDMIIHELCKICDRDCCDIFNRYVTDTPEVFMDTPVGLQLVGRPHEEAAVIRVGEIVEKALGTHTTIISP